MTYQWCAISFSSYMFQFYTKYLPGDIYTNSITAGAADIPAIVFAGLVY